MANLQKAERFSQDNYYAQALRHAEMALNKLKLLKDRPFDDLDNAYTIKTHALRFLGRYREAKESAEEMYSMWAVKDIRNPNTIWAAFELIECCLQLEEFFNAELFARTAYEIINEQTSDIIPHDLRQHFRALGAAYLSRATYNLAKAGGIAPEAKKATGVKAIALARESLEKSIPLFGGIDSSVVADSMLTLADALDYFNEVDDDEVIRLYEQAKAIFARAQGSMSSNVGLCAQNLGITYRDRATRALRDNYEKIEP